MVNTGIKEQYKEKIIGILSTLFPQAKVYLFGSRAEGKYSEFSDIDIAIDAGKKIEYVHIDEANSMLANSNIP